MNKHLLLTISDDHSASSNLRFLRTFFPDICKITLTLFYVVPKPMERDFGNKDHILDQIEENKLTKGNATLAKAKKDLEVMAGCNPEHIKTKIVHSRLGTVHEIIAEAHEGLYDAVVMGRRGLGWFEELFEDSVSHNILWEQISFPIWFCRYSPEKTRRNVLLCVDGSEESLRMADHVGFILGKETDHEVTMLYVQSKSGEEGSAKQIFKESEAMLTENSFPAKQINRQILPPGNIAKSIQAEAENGGYAVVAVGRRTGEEAHKRKLFLPGSVSVTLQRSLKDISLWISK